MDSAEAAAPAAAPVGLGPVVRFRFCLGLFLGFLLRVRILLGFIHFGDEVLQLGRSRNSVGQVVRRYFRAFSTGMRGFASASCRCRQERQQDHLPAVPDRRVSFWFPWLLPALHPCRFCWFSHIRRPGFSRADVMSFFSHRIPCGCFLEGFHGVFARRCFPRRDWL